MVSVSSFVVTLIMAYGFGRGRSESIDFTFLHLFFINSRCYWFVLTSDLFNLYVMFEIMLLASFVLVTLGQSVEQLRAIVYVVLNILGSWLLLLELACYIRQSEHLISHI